MPRSKGYHFGKDTRDHKDAHFVPGPGAYTGHQSAHLKYGLKQQPSYGFGSRLGYNPQQKVPGPGSYEPKKQIFSHIGGIMNKDLKDSLKLSKTPGPGTYQYKQVVKQKAPSYSLSHSARDYNTSRDLNIGPGQYDHTTGFKKISEASPAYLVGGKSQKLKFNVSDVPGPGSYESPLLKSRKSIKIGEKLRDLQYMKVPGPGSYQSQSPLMRSRKSIKIGQKLKDSQYMKVPGPGSYQQIKYDNDSWLRGGGRYSLAKDSRLKQINVPVPGPGAYEDKVIQIKSPKGKISFGKDSRLKLQKNQSPGPGHYQINDELMDNVSKYITSNP